MNWGFPGVFSRRVGKGTERKGRGIKASKHGEIADLPELYYVGLTGYFTTPITLGYLYQLLLPGHFA